MKKILTTTALILLVCISGFSQNGILPCPQVVVFGPNSVLQPGETTIIKASIQNEKIYTNLTYNWSIDKGTIIEGQGTSVIKISTEGLSDTTIITAVEIELSEQHCESIDGQTIKVAPAVKNIDYNEDYGKIPLFVELARLDPFINELQQNPECRAYVWMKVTKDERFSDVKKHIRKLLKYIKSREMTADMFTFVIEKSITHSTRLRTILKNEELPKCENCEIIKGSELK